MINSIINGDCIEVMKDIEDESIDLVFTDPPYNVSGKNKNIPIYKKGKPTMVNRDYGEWDYLFDPIPFLEQAKRVLKDNGSIIVYTSEQLLGEYRDWFELHMHPKQLLIWIKPNAIPQLMEVGYRQTTELLFWALKNKNTKANPNFIFSEQTEMTNVIYSPTAMGNERTAHPTQKPLSVTKKIIATHCQIGGIVLDPFAGSGTTGVAAMQLNRNFIMIEQEKQYYEIAKRRLEKEMQNVAIFDIKPKLPKEKRMGGMFDAE